MKNNSRIITALILLMEFLSIPARAQGITPLNDQEKQRFETVQHTLEKTGYTAVVPVGHGQGANEALFAMTAMHNGKGVLVIALELNEGNTMSVVEIESDKTPAEIGIHGISFQPFLGENNLVDVVVSHRPFRLEESYSFDSHHVLRKQDAALSLACDFAGASTSSYSKGIGSTTSQRTVTVEKLAGVKNLQFEVKAIQETTRQPAQGKPERSESLQRYELEATGICK